VGRWTIGLRDRHGAEAIAQPKSQMEPYKSRSGRPAKKTAEGLDLEMADYFDAGNTETTAAPAAGSGAPRNALAIAYYQDEPYYPKPEIQVPVASGRRRSLCDVRCKRKRKSSVAQGGGGAEDLTNPAVCIPEAIVDQDTGGNKQERPGIGPAARLY